MPQGSWREFNQDATAQPEKSKSFVVNTFSYVRNNITKEWSIPYLCMLIEQIYIIALKYPN